MEVLKKYGKIAIQIFFVFLVYLALRPISKTYEGIIQNDLDSNFNGTVIKKGIEPMTHNTPYIYLDNRKEFPIGKYFYDSIQVNDSVVKLKNSEYIKVFRKDTIFSINLVERYKILTGDSNNYVNDVEKIFTEEENHKLNKKISKSKLPFYLVTVSGTYHYNNYDRLSHAIFSSRRLNDNALLFIISNSKRIFKTTNLETTIPKEIIYPIIEKTIILNFKDKEYYRGINAFIDEVNTLIEKNPNILINKQIGFYFKLKF